MQIKAFSELLYFLTENQQIRKPINILSVRLSSYISINQRELSDCRFIIQPGKSFGVTNQRIVSIIGGTIRILYSQACMLFPK